MSVRVRGVIVAGVVACGGLAVATPLLSGTQAPSAPQTASAPVSCTRVASPAGRAHVPGTIRGARRLVDALEPGGTGCLRAGRYRTDLTIAGKGVGLRSFPGERATLVGRLWITRSARDVSISHLHLDGRNRDRLPSPTVNGSRVSFSHVDVTNRNTAICFVIGSNGRYGRASDTVIRDSRIHHCGRRPVTNHDHGVYVAAADRTRILGNLIHDNADRGVQLYPHANGTRIAGNVIDGNGVGVIFSGLRRLSSDNNVVEHNVITNSRVRADVESFYEPGTRPGRGNVVRRNCISPATEPLLRGETVGFEARENRFETPGFGDRAAGDFRLAPDSFCARLLRRAG